MRRSTVLSIVLALVFLAGSVPAKDAAASVQLGVRGGYYNSTGDIFEGSGNVGGNGLWGVTGAVSLLLPLEIEFAYERYTKDFDTNQIPSGSGTFRDNAYLLTGKLRLPITPPMSPIWFHAGAGVGLHHIETSGGIDQRTNEIITEAKDQGEWHGVAGADVKLGSFHFYGEYRFQDVTEKDGPRFHSVYAGVNLYLE